MHAAARILLSALVLVAVVVSAGCDGGDDDSTQPASLLEGTPWGFAMPLHGILIRNGVKPGATFAEGRMTGSTGCNRYSAPYKLGGDKLELGATVVTKKACLPPFDAIERGYLAALARVEGWHVDDGVLTLSDGDGNEAIRFERRSPVGSWQATRLQRDLIRNRIVGTKITASFGEDGTLTGSAGCNRYQSRYVADPSGEITIQVRLATKNFCATPEGVMKQEQRFLTLLRKAFGFQLEQTFAFQGDNRRLVLTAEDGKRLLDFKRK